MEEIYSKSILTPHLTTLITDQKYYLNLNPLDPDYYIEHFWYGFKDSMINFYILIEKDYTHIILWSTNLNELKNNKKYNNIESSIREYIALYSLDIIKYSYDTSLYNEEILITNIKRWNKISNQFNFNKTTEYNKILCLFKIYLELKRDLDGQNFLLTLHPIEDILKFNTIDNIIKYSFDNQKNKILDLLKEIPEFNLLINIKKLFPQLYTDSKTKDIKMVKLCLKYKKIYQS